MDAQRKGDPKPATGEFHDNLAIAYLSNIPTRISNPDVDVPRRANEAYFAVWADTQYGSAAVDILYSQLPGLRYNSTFPDDEIHSFVRERLTKNTDLNNAFASGSITGCTKDMLAIAFLASVDYRLKIKDALVQMGSIFWSNRGLPANVAHEIRDILEEADDVFDSDFGIKRHLPSGTPEFFLQPEYENKILAHRYCLEMFAYFKMPEYRPKNKECSPLMGRLPTELMSMVAQNLLVFKEPIKVIRRPRVSYRKTEYCFKVCEPTHMCSPAAFLVNTRLRPGWIISALKTFFALSKTYRKNYYLVREVFFKRNKILLHCFYTSSGHSFGSHEIKLWLEVIGREARRSLGNFSIDLHLKTRNQDGLDRDAVHTMIKLIGQSPLASSTVLCVAYSRLAAA
ncbi:uncharacterized protein ALTATR162_LOCUS9070 [Alternaria atra]|uniref:Uncharacterized protein n=1 Tax=Alternaria atra TaxID=119953 RepID=A0A8J2I6H2_9PLEO|nr:uncharacterized protein ALTATR162_LOCUS9070 [Alternaria atra]CAG5179174.1 unnamed protein product [Alternaria atra]